MNVKTAFNLEKVINNCDFNNKLFLDIETYQYNCNEGLKNPSKYKNMIFSLAVSVIYKNEIYCNIYNNFKDFLNLIDKGDKEFTFYIHNGNKYDNHFLLWELLYYFKLPNFNLYLDRENVEAQNLSKKISEYQDDAIFQKRIKSKNNLDMIFRFNGNIFHFEDTFLKTNLSLRTIGKKLYDLNLVDECELKTEFDYTKYNIDNDLTNVNAKKYSQQIFKNLNKYEKTYIYNDIILLAKLYANFNKLFKGFDVDKMTLSQNILSEYTISDMSKYQLLQKIDNYRNIDNSDYFFNGENFYNYLKKYYKGGLNFYNDKYIDKILSIKGFSIDINSSYPAIMYNDKMPTFLYKYGYNKTFYYNKLYDDKFYLFELTKETFNNLLCKTNSVNVNKMLVKYYNNFTENVYINSNTLKLMNEIFDMRIEKIHCNSYLIYDCITFASKSIIDKYYKIKQNGKSKYKLIYNNPNDIKLTRYKNDVIFNTEEIYLSKVYINGIYGIPALRAYFNDFKIINNDIINFENGYKNNERNIIFSIFVTSKALYNLLYPLKFLNDYEIDNLLLYTDTDSLYFKDEKIIKKFPKNLINNLNIGKFSYDCKNISYFYVLNHKKYAYYNNEKNKIVVKCGGVPISSFNADKYNNFVEFIENEFYYGKEVHNQKSILNKQGTISIYPSKTLLDKGNEYDVLYKNYNYDEFKKSVKKEIEKNDITDVEYIESTIGVFSFSDFYDLPNKIGEDLKKYMYKQGYIKRMLGVKNE